ncbi:MAG: TIGR03936 family radical SAM-associated protein, partial [Thermostichus sp. BF3_bins_97]
GHLDLMRLWERACRRAGLPLAFSGGYHPMPRLSNANALPIGQVGSGEILDLELLPRHLFGERLPFTPEELQTRLTEQLPAEIPIQSIWEIDRRDPSATEAVYAAEYQLTVRSEVADPDWLGWVNQILDTSEICIEKISKSVKHYPINARALLYHLQFQGQASDGSARLFYRGSCRNDGAYLRPTHLAQMAQQLGLPTWDLRTVERLRLLLQNSQSDPD